MASRLIIVRHAKAERGRGEMDDRDRELTKAGLRSCKAKLPVAMGLVGRSGRGPVAVWSSPARRAVQTAQVAATALGADRVEPHDSLYADDTTAFLRELRAAPGTVVAVGHNPFLEELYRTLAGHGVDLGTSAAAAFLLDGPEAPALEWFVQGPDYHRWKTLVEMESALKRSWKGICAGRDAFLAGPLDVETLHRYRISLRVARSLVQFLRPYLKEGACDRAEGALRELARETSHLRELDVFAELMHERGASGLADGRIALELEIERNDERAALMQSLSSEDDERRMRHVRRLLKKPAWKRPVEAEGLAANDVAARFELSAGALAEDLESCNLEDVEATHAVRKRSKRLRYVARELKGLLGDGALDEGQEARRLQDRLGEICDARVNADLAEHFGEGELAREQLERAEALVREL